MIRRFRVGSAWATALIVTVATGCDNVDWGGADIAIVPPPPGAAAGDGDAGPAEERLPEGPIVYYVAPGAGEATLIPIAEIGRDTLLPIGPRVDPQLYAHRFIATHLRTGTEFALFRGGARVGTFVLTQAGLPPEGVCPRVPHGRGVLELMAGADTIPEFLALAKSHAPPDAAHGITGAPQPDRRMQILGPILAERLLRARDAPLPGNWSRAEAQLKPFPMAGAEDPAFAATFLVDDTLGTGYDNEGYSLFLIAEPRPEIGYDTAYADFTPYEREGKAAPRVVDFLDWDRDGQTELLLEVYGIDRSWFETVSSAGGRWRKLVSTRCE
ncbi:MAG TPA: hypothetical protein VF212_17225 [Longimicrobiales bacterium]